MVFCGIDRYWGTLFGVVKHCVSLWELRTMVWYFVVSTSIVWSGLVFVGNVWHCVVFQGIPG